MRITRKEIDRQERIAQDFLLDVSVCHRNGCYALDTVDGSGCYESGLTAREAYLMLRGMVQGAHQEAANSLKKRGLLNAE